MTYSDIHYYNIALQCYDEIDFSELEHAKDTLVISNSSVHMANEHEFLPAPLRVINLDLKKDNAIMGYYRLYLNEQDEFIDEVLCFF